ncbi:THO complex subunit 7 [Actinomortierella ambigua]|nr:THO complex subunit 7 [Actinomortierella ambigua]
MKHNPKSSRIQHSPASLFILSSKATGAIAAVAVGLAAYAHPRVSRMTCPGLLLSVGGLQSAWLGATMAISLLEAPVKFKAPTPSRRGLVDVGRHVFSAINKVEVVLSVFDILFWYVLARRNCILIRPDQKAAVVVATTNSFWAVSKALGWRHWIRFLPSFVVLGAQTCLYLPMLRSIGARYVEGQPTEAAAKVHGAYVGLELIKLITSRYSVNSVNSVNMDDDTIIRSKLAVDEKSLQRLTKRFHQWSSNLFKESDEEFEKGMGSVLLELSQVELKLQHAQLVAAMTFRERQHYHQEQQQIEDQVQAAQQELVQLEQQLDEAKKERSNKIQYDELTNEINLFPTRHQSMQQVDHLRREIAELEAESLSYQHMLAWRRKQFLAALVSLQGIQESIVEDRKEEERLLALKINRRFEKVGSGGGGLGGNGSGRIEGDGSGSEDEDFDEKVRAQQQEQQEHQQQQQRQQQQQQQQQQLQPPLSSLQGPLSQDMPPSSLDSTFLSQSSVANGTQQQSGGDGTAMDMDSTQEPLSSSLMSDTPHVQDGRRGEEEEEGATHDDDNNSTTRMAVDTDINETPEQSPSVSSSLAGSPFLPGTPRISRTSHLGEEGAMTEDDMGDQPSPSTRPTPSPADSQIGTPTSGSSYEPGDAVGSVPTPQT